MTKITLRRQSGSLRWCLNLAIQRAINSKKDPTKLAGKADLTFRVSRDGVVQRPQFRKPVLGDKELTRCMEQKVKGWKFAPPRDDKSASIAVPVMIKVRK